MIIPAHAWMVDGWKEGSDLVLNLSPVKSATGRDVKGSVVELG